VSANSTHAKNGYAIQPATVSAAASSKMLIKAQLQEFVLGAGEGGTKGPCTIFYAFFFTIFVYFAKL
jgi:hypothetical protein